MTLPGLRRSIPNGLVALSVSVLVLLSGVTLAPPSEVAADTSGGQASIYSGVAQTSNICTGFEPPFFNAVDFQTTSGRQSLSSRLIIFNPRTTAVSLNVRATGGGNSFSRAVSIPSNTSAFVASFDSEWTPGTTPGGTGATRVPLPNNFRGTIRAFNCEQFRLPAALEVGVATITTAGVAPQDGSELASGDSASGDLV